MAKVDLSAVNEKLKSREPRLHQSIAKVPKEVRELKRATHKLGAKARELSRTLEEIKRKKRRARGLV